MCRFHSELAIEITTDKMTGKADPVAHAITLTALSQFWIEQSIPEMPDCDGEFRYLMATEFAQNAFNRSNLDQDTDAILGYRYHHIDDVRRALAKVIEKQNLHSTDSLNIPKKLWPRTQFLDNAYLYVLDGVAESGFSIAPQVKVNPNHPLRHTAYEPLRHAAFALSQEPGIRQILETMIRGKFAEIFVEARKTAHPTLLKAFEVMPKPLQEQFKNCASCVGEGSGGAALSHAGCLAVPVLSGTGSASASVLSGVMNAVMLGTSPVVAGGVTIIRDWRQGRPQSGWRIAASMSIAFAIAVGIKGCGGHDHLGDHHATTVQAKDQESKKKEDHHNHSIALAQAWLQKQPFEKRKQIYTLAAEKNVSPVDYALDLCASDPSIKVEMDKLTPQNGQTPNP